MNFNKKYGKAINVLIHICFWIGFIAIPAILPKPQHRPFHPPFHPGLHPDIQIIAIAIGLQIGYFYLNYFVFFNLFKTRRYYLFFIVNLAILSVIFVIRCVYNRFDGLNMMIFRELSPYIFFFLAGTSLRIIRDQFRLQSELLENEVTFLRNQINPHFLFNVLNMVNSFARTRPELIEPTVEKLSNLMRYMLYNTDKQTSLMDEVEHLNNYIELQRTRYNDSVKISYHTEGEIPDKTIEPMLLIPIVENAFKHGTALIDSPEIHIKLTSSDKTLSLEVSNRYKNDLQENLSPYSGIGLQNIIRRLELLYPDSHVLNHFSENGWYKIQLTIAL
ncbi:sensor histidine kinase [Paludibacter jiangxiensis]|uniref:Histidine kinase n=1 Tax=Paludibacter jiangxiensis TaxID=681398 RepID=A0A170ZIZ4_9BACT|nr:histidine kinase [Paludibacter jiangxiensis]GAT62713.1 histidine kinase [Paludibacter jiangxiensis]